MSSLRRLFLQSMFCAAATLCWTGCGKHEAASAEEKPAVSQPHVVNGEVSLGPDAPELKQMSIEPVKTVSMAADEITAPAKIEVNPNRVGHAVLPVPGRIVRVMTKLGDSVEKGQPLFMVESAAIAEAESGYVQAQSSVRQAELALSKAEADAARLTDLYE